MLQSNFRQVCTISPGLSDIRSARCPQPLEFFGAGYSDAIVLKSGTFCLRFPKNIVDIKQFLVII